MKTKIRKWRWDLADVLSFLACKLRGHTWTQLPANYPGVYGNRAAALKDRIWQLAVLANYPKPHTDYLDEIEEDIDELARLAGENWGHIPPCGTHSIQRQDCCHDH